MATEAQIIANRQNAEFSTGPKTQEGKSRSSRNAVSFGIYSAGDFVRPDETHTYQLFCQSFRKELRPEGALEQTLAAEIIHAAWRLRRCSVAESEIEFTENGPDPLLSPTQTAIDRARGQAQRQLLRATSELRRLQNERRVNNERLREELSDKAEGPPAQIPATKRTQSESVVHTARAEFQSQPSIPRSARCPCGSGLKYKRCCGKNAPAVLQQAA